MTEARVPLPEGLTGPFLRSFSKQVGGQKVYESAALLSVPWRVDRSYRVGFVNLGTGSITNVSSWPFVLGLPSTAAAGTAIVVKAYRMGVSSDGSAGSSLILAVGRASFSGALTGTQLTGVAQPHKSGFPTSLADIRRESAPIQGPVHRRYAFPPASGNRFAPSLFNSVTYRPQNWHEMFVFAPGEYLGAKFELAQAAAQPNGHERLYVQVDYDEVTLQ